MSSWPTATIEILDLRDSDAGFAVPGVVRINGVEVAVPAAHPPKIHDFQADPGAPVMVTVTMYARRVVVGRLESSEEPA